MVVGERDAVLTRLPRDPSPGLTRLVAGGALVASYGAAVAVANRVSLPRLVPGPVVDEQVTVVVPARDEAPRIAAIVSDLRAQTGLHALRVVILDDDSSDGTADLATAAAEGDERITVVRSTQPPPEGWTGKAAACAAAVAHAGSTTDSGIVVFVELWAIAFIQKRYMETPFIRAVFQVVLGGALVLAAGILIGGS